jgi:hypothetical protein
MDGLLEYLLRSLLVLAGEQRRHLVQPSRQGGVEFTLQQCLHASDSCCFYVLSLPVSKLLEEGGPVPPEPPAPL